MRRNPAGDTRRRLSRLLATTCLTAMPGLFLGANAQTIDETGTALGNGPDTGPIAGGTVNASGGSDVHGVGVSTGGGGDNIENTGAIDVDVLAEQSLVFSGFGRFQDGADVHAQGIGLFGASGGDVLINAGDIDVQATGDADIVNLGLSLFGFFNFNAPSTVEVTSSGIDGGRGRDVIENRSTVVAGSTSGVSMVGQNPSSFQRNASIDITADAYTAGVRSGADVTNSGSLDLTAASHASSLTIDLEVVNGVVVDSSTNANSTLVGIEGGGGRDQIANSGSVLGVATASASRTSVALNFSDGGIGESSVNAAAESAGLLGGGNDDEILNTGGITLSAAADVVSTGVEINLIDIAGGRFDLSPEARATGIDGGAQDDLLDNSGSITATVQTDTVSTNVNLSLVDVTIIGGRIAAGFDAGVEADEEPPIQAIATGLAGGRGEDVLFNRAGGGITLSGVADATSTSVSVAAIGVPDAAFQAIFEGETLASLDTFASSRIVGMTGGLHDDELFNLGSIMGTTTSTASQTGVAVSVPVGFLPDAAGFLPGFTLGGAGAGAWADAVGLSGDGGDDALLNDGLIDLSSIADALAVGVSVELPDLAGADGVAVDISLTLADVVTEADASATGMAGGDGDDILGNTENGDIDVDATATAASTGVGVTAAIEGEGVVSEGVVVQASSDAEASATAIDGGDGDDTIVNDGSAGADAMATATTVGVSIGVEGVAQGGAAGIAAVDGSAIAIATSRAITGGEGSDLVVNNGSLSSDATADAGATGVSVVLTGATTGGFAGGGTVSLSGATATANAAGVGLSWGDEGAENNGSIEATATANAFGDSVSVGVSGAMAGLTLNASLADSSTTAMATASGIDALFGSQSITNLEMLSAVSLAEADSDSVGAELGVAAEAGVALGAALTRTVTDATATSTGIRSDFGRDRISNLGTINADATAHAGSTSLAIALNGTMAGVGISVAAADGSTSATARASGIDTGRSRDTVETLGTLTSKASATAMADSIGVEFAAAIEAGLAAGAALTLADVTADADSVGVATGSSSDQLVAAGVVDVGATALANAVTVSVAAQGTAAGLAAGGSVVDATSTANAAASGLNAGSGDDAIASAATLTALSDATAGSTGVGVVIGVAGVGLAGGLGLADASSAANSAAAGIEGGLGADEIRNDGALDVDGKAHASGDTVSVVLQGAVEGASLAVSLTDATVQSTAYATGIAGDDASSPDGDDEDDAAQTGNENADTIVNAGTAYSDAIAMATGASVSIAAPVSFVPLGFALAEAETMARGDAYGIAAGYGDDEVFNLADVTVKSDVDATGASAAASVSVLALGNFTGEAYANAYGIAGGAGDDVLFNGAEVMSTALADVLGVTVALNLAGGAVGDLTTTADGDAFGVFGGAGEDILVNEGGVTSTADVRAASTNVSLAVAGFTVNDVSTTARADATGMGGGADHDHIENLGRVDAITLAESPAVSVSLVGVGAVFNDARTGTEAASFALSGGEDDDEILNAGVVTATSTARTTGVGVSVGLASGGTANVSTVADARAHGIDGGEGDDTIVNQDMLTATASSTTTSTGVNVNIIGAAFTDADTISTAHAVGISGGAGDDEILNEGAISATSGANNNAGTVTVSLGGVGEGDINTTATASAAGIEGGDGDDRIAHAGTITTSTNANVSARSVTVGLVGSGLGDIRLTAETDSFGIDGGAGSDEIMTFDGSSIFAGSSIAGSAVNTSIQLVGGTSNKNIFGFTPASTGVAGGDGADVISLGGTTQANASSNFTLRNTAISLIGVAFEESGIASSPTAIGVSGGEGWDQIFISNLVDARATNTFSMTGLSVNLAGYSSARPTVGGTATSIGVDAGDDADFVFTEALVSSRASSLNTVSGTQTTFLGANQSSSQTGAVSVATGIAGGAGDDMLMLSGATQANASATAALQSLGYTTIGASVANDGITAIATAVGADAGSDDDTAFNEGDILVESSALLTTSGSIGVSFGGAVSNAVTTARAASDGLLGGDGEDFLLNTGTILARSLATGVISSVNYVFGGAATSSATANTTASALGIGGGAGDDEVYNDGVVEAHATSVMTARGNTSATFGGARSSSTVSSAARSVGISGDAGDDVLRNSGEIRVSASASPDSTNSANVGGLFVDGVTVSRTSTSTRVIGVDGAAGANDIWNTGAVVIETGGLARTESRSDGDILDNIFGLDLDAVASATSSNNGQDARGLSAGNEATSFFNSGLIDVAIRGGGYAYANADGDAIVDGDGTSTAIVGVSDANAYGIGAGNGGNLLVNDGEVVVLARPTGNADAISDADGVDAFAQPDSSATASVSLNRVRAAGVWFGDGDDRVFNQGLIDVTSAPQASQAEADAGFGGDVLGIDAFATATASANDASAYGLRLGEGDNQAFNSGEIIARSLPRAVAHADARGVGFDGDAEASATANALNAFAVGVETGNGDDVIWNTGSITAISSPSVSAAVTRVTGYACAIDIGDVEVCENGEAGGSGPDENPHNPRSIGVATNGGDDVLVNAGAITASIGAGIGNGEAIIMGSGNDTLVMADSASVLGSIDLGADDDTMVLSGVSSSNSAASGGAGVDSLVFAGEGAFDHGFSSFETARKFGDGVFAVASLPSLISLRIDGGALQSAAGYTFKSDGTFTTYVDSSGGNGAFATGGTATLGGVIEILEIYGLYADGTTYDVVTAANVAGAFSSEILPDAKPLLNFDVLQGATGVQIVANAASFATVAASGERDQAFAMQLDEAALMAEGSLLAHLARIQHLPEGADFAKEISRLNPGRYGDLARHTHWSSGKFEAGTRHRMRSMRKKSHGHKHGHGLSGVVQPHLSEPYSQAGAGDGASFGAWTALFGAQEGGFGDNYGSIYGFDQVTPMGTIVGGSVVATRSNPMMTNPLLRDSRQALVPGEGARADNMMMSVYASHRIADDQYLDAIVTYGEQDYMTSLIALNGARRLVEPIAHGGSNFSVSLETGRSFAFAGGQSEIFGGVRYASIVEDGFNGSSLFDTAFDVSRNNSRNLEGEVGVRVGWEVETPLGAMAPRFSLSWNRNLALAGDRIVARFADAPGFAFSLPGELREENELRFGAELDLWASEGMSLTSRFQSDLLAPDAAVDALVGLRFFW